MQKIKLAFFLDNLGMGGIQKSMINMLKILDLNKYSIDLYLYSNDIFCNDEILKEINVIYLKKNHIIFKFLPFNISRKLAKKVMDTTKEYDYAIDFDSYQFASANCCIDCKAKRKIMWIHNDIVNECKYNIKTRILHFFMKGKYKYFDTYVGVSEGVIEPFKSKNNISSNNFWVIPNHISTDEIFKKSKEKANIEIDKNKYNLISVGRLCYQKGYDILLKYLKELKEIRTDFHFYLVGDGDKKKSLMKYVRKNNLDSFVTFLGKDSNPFKYERLMDGFVLTSRYEGQGMVILEACSLGLDIFISKNIEKYNGYNIVGCDNIVSELSKVEKKKKKTLDDLSSYNDNIVERLNELFE